MSNLFGRKFSGFHELNLPTYHLSTLFSKTAFCAEFPCQVSNVSKVHLMWSIVQKRQIANLLSSSSILKINFQIRLHFRLFYVRNFSNSQNLTLAKPLLFITFEVWLYSRLLLMYYVSVFYDDGMIITSSLLSFPYVMVKVSLKAIWKSPSSFICASESAVVYKRDEERRLCCFSRLYSKCIRLWMKHEKATYLRWWVYDLCEKGRSILYGSNVQ